MTPHPSSEPTERRSPLRTVLLAVAALAGVLLVVAILAFLFIGNEEESAQPAAEDPYTAVADAITAEVGTATVEFTAGQVSVDFPVQLGATPSSAVLSAQEDTIGVLRAVQDSGWTETVVITARVVPAEQTGDQGETEVLRAVYLPETVVQIDPDGIDQAEVWDVADEQFVPPSLRE